MDTFIWRYNVKGFSKSGLLSSGGLIIEALIYCTTISFEADIILTYDLRLKIALTTVSGQVTTIS